MEDLLKIGTPSQTSAEWRLPQADRSGTTVTPAALGRGGRLEIPQARRLRSNGKLVVRHHEFRSPFGTYDVD